MPPLVVSGLRLMEMILFHADLLHKTMDGFQWRKHLSSHQYGVCGRFHPEKSSTPKPVKLRFKPWYTDGYENTRCYVIQRLQSLLKRRCVHVMHVCMPLHSGEVSCHMVYSRAAENLPWAQNVCLPQERWLMNCLLLHSRRLHYITLHYITLSRSAHMQGHLSREYSTLQTRIEKRETSLVPTAWAQVHG